MKFYILGFLSIFSFVVWSAVTTTPAVGPNYSAPATATAPGGSDTYVQYNDSSAFGGDSGLVFNETTNALTVDGPLNITSSTAKIRLKDGNTSGDPGILIFTDATDIIFQTLAGDDVTPVPFNLHATQVVLNNDSGTLPFKLRTNGNDAVDISAAGAVKFTTYGAGTLETDGSGNITAASDETLKNIIGPYSRGAEDLKAVKPIMFKWKAGDASGFSYAGFSAQNVEKGVPEAITEGPDGKLLIQNRTLIAALVNAVNELSARIEKLEGAAYVPKAKAPAPARQKSPPLPPKQKREILKPKAMK